MSRVGVWGVSKAVFKAEGSGKCCYILGEFGKAWGGRGGDKA